MSLPGDLINKPDGKRKLNGSTTLVYRCLSLTTFCCRSSLEESLCRKESEMLATLERLNVLKIRQQVRD